MDVREIARVMKGLSDETRLWILWLLSKRPLCVCEIMGILGITQTKASRHLIYLKNAGILEGVREDRWMVYRIKTGLPRWLEKVIHEVIKVVSDLPEAKIFLKRMKEVVSDGTYRERRGVNYD